MSRMIFVNLPVANLDASMKFYEALGFHNNPQFTDATAACMVWSDTIHVMLLTHAKWNTFTTRPICPSTSSEVSLALSMDDRAAVDALQRRRRGQWRNRRHQSRAGSRFHVRPRHRRSRRPHLGTLLDGYGRHARRRMTAYKGMPSATRKAG